MKNQEFGGAVRWKNSCLNPFDKKIHLFSDTVIHLYILGDCIAKYTNVKSFLETGNYLNVNNGVGGHKRFFLV